MIILKKNMKKILIVLGLFVTVGTFAQTSLVKRTAMKSNNFGVSYTLPKTSLITEIVVNKVTEKNGSYYAYAERFLQLKDVVKEDKTYYELKEVRVVNKGIPNSDESYLIEFKPGTIAPYVYLTNNNLLCAINAEIVLDAPQKEADKPAPKKKALDPNSILSGEILGAGSIIKMAEMAANQIYRIRESRMDIITGQADNLPPDGEAMKITLAQLDEQEKALISLFSGTTERTEEVYEITLIPEEEFKKEVLFRFSEKLGVLDPDDLAGTPIYIDLTNVGEQPQLDPKEAAKREKMSGVFYNVPGTGHYTITMSGKTLLMGETPVVQFGVKEVLAAKLFEDKKLPVKITFYPETGAIKQIAQ